MLNGTRCELGEVTVQPSATVAELNSRAFLPVGESQRQMDYLWISPGSRLESELSEDLQHPGVFGQNFRRQFVQSGFTRDLDEA